MAALIFSYHQKPQKEPVLGTIYYIDWPAVPIRLGHKHSIDKLPTLCLVDSGSDYNLFPADWGEALGMKVKQGIIIPILGIGEHGIITYRHRVKMYIGKFTFDVDVYFSYEQTVPLLGRYGFFNYFKRVIFNDEKRQLELEI